MSIPLHKIPFLNKRVKFPVAPHIPGGFATPQQLRAIADIAERHGGTIKFMAGGVTILGLNLADGEKALTELGLSPESFIAQSVRGVILCPAKPHCPRAMQDSVALGLKLDALWFGKAMPGKVRIGVSGCPNCCAEVMVKDIGIYGTAAGYTVAVGGNAGRQAQVAQPVAENLSEAQALELVHAILSFYEQHGHPKERLGTTIARVGWPSFEQATAL